MFTVYLAEGKFEWEDVTPDVGLIPWHHWSPTKSEPDNYNEKEHCVVVTNKVWFFTPVINLTDYEALDITCRFVIYFICEKSGTSERSLSVLKNVRSFSKLALFIKYALFPKSLWTGVICCFSALFAYYKKIKLNI